MNVCDHDHETREEIRRLPLDGAGAALVCHEHHLAELRFRVERAGDTGAQAWDYPAWEALVVVAPPVANGC